MNVAHTNKEPAGWMAICTADPDLRAAAWWACWVSPTQCGARLLRGMLRTRLSAAPIAAIAAFDTEAEAIERANAAPYGLSAYAFTRDLNRAFRLMEAIEAGMIGINDGLPTTSNAPFGGVKQSGWGRELGSEGLNAFLETKHISLSIG